MYASYWFQAKSRYVEIMDDFGSYSDTDHYLDGIRNCHVETECGENDSVNNPLWYNSSKDELFRRAGG